jgi:hypothetical protein
MNKPLVLIAVFLGLVFLVLSYIYFTTAASSLPSYFPGHEVAKTTHVHYKHGIGLLILGIGSFVFAWFQSGKKKHPAAKASDNEEKNG